MKDKQELHLFSAESTSWDVVKAIESLSKQQGGYSWQPVAENPPIVVPDRIKRRFEKLNLEPMADLVAAKQSDWKVIVPALEKLLPPGLGKNDSGMLLDLLLVTYAANMGVGIPYIAFG